MAKNRKTPDMNLPMWFDGQNINEALFCDEFLQERRIIFANGAFFTPDGRVTDDLPLRGEIYEKLKFCAVNNVPRKITNILEVLKLEAQEPDFPPEQDRIHVANGTLMLNGTFTEGKPAIVRSRLPIAYKPDAPAPVIWLNFLDGLLHAEDIPTLQEFIGYCLIPSNKGQRMMVIKGNGGEGKSQIGAVLSAMFGTNMKDGSIGKISENRFARADLEHILLCVDDDKRLFSSLFFGIGIFFVEGGGLFEHANHRHRQPERRRWQNNNLCELGNRSGTGRKESASDRRGPARKPDNQLGKSATRQAAIYTVGCNGQNSDGSAYTPRRRYSASCRRR